MNTRFYNARRTLFSALLGAITCLTGHAQNASDLNSFGLAVGNGSGSSDLNAIPLGPIKSSPPVNTTSDILKGVPPTSTPSPAPFSLDGTLPPAPPPATVPAPSPTPASAIVATPAPVPVALPALPASQSAGLAAPASRVGNLTFQATPLSEYVNDISLLSPKKIVVEVQQPVLVTATVPVSQWRASLQQVADTNGLVITETDQEIILKGNQTTVFPSATIAMNGTTSTSASSTAAVVASGTASPDLDSDTKARLDQKATDLDKLNAERATLLNNRTQLINKEWDLGARPYAPYNNN
jgi:hypothetical protein